MFPVSDRFALPSSVGNSDNATLQEEYEVLWPEWFKGADVLMVGYDVNSTASVGTFGQVRLIEPHVAAVMGSDNGLPLTPCRHRVRRL